MYTQRKKRTHCGGSGCHLSVQLSLRSVCLFIGTLQQFAAASHAYVTGLVLATVTSPVWYLPTAVLKLKGYLGSCLGPVGGLSHLLLPAHFYSTSTIMNRMRRGTVPSSGNGLGVISRRAALFRLTVAQRLIGLHHWPRDRYRGGLTGRRCSTVSQWTVSSSLPLLQGDRH